MESNAAAAAPKRQDPLVGQHIGHYRVLRKLGEGGMGAVFEAVHEQIGKRAAIKVLHAQFCKDPEFARRFFNEARAVNIVQHNGLVSIFDFGQLPDGTAFIVMDYLDGETLSARLKRMGGRLGLEALNITRQMASALAAAHAKGIIHRDLKPANVVIVPEPEAPGGERAKILDFGVAKLGEDPTGAPGDEPGAHEEHPVTRTGVFMGTPKYMAPEQCRGAGQVDEKADVYSLGAMLYQMLGGRVPFTAPGDGEVMAMHIFATPRPIRDLEPSVSEELAGMVHAMLAKKPEERPSMTQVAADLGRLSGTFTGALNIVGLSGAFPITPGAVPPITLNSVPAVPAGAQAISMSQGVPVIGLVASGKTPSTPPTPLAHGPASAPGLHPPDSISQNSFTLGGAAGQASGPLRTRSRSRLLLVAGTPLLFLVTVGTVLYLSRDRPDPKPPVAVTPPVPQVPLVRHTVRWSIGSEPSGAQVLRESDKKPLGTTPWTTEQPTGQGTQAVVISLPGHADRRVVLDLGGDATRTEKLDPLQPAPPPPPEQKASPVAVKPVKKKPGGSSKGRHEREEMNDDDIPLVK